jgi:hypothetical protein
MPYLIRKALLMASPTVDVKKTGDDVAGADWHIATHEALRTVEMNFKFGQVSTS